MIRLRSKHGAALGVVLMAACAAGNPGFRSLYANAQSGFTSQRTEVLRDADAYQAAWGRAHQGGGTVDTAPPVDFSEEIVAVISLGSRPSAGHGIEVTGVRAVDGVTVVQYDVISPGPECMTASVMTAPVAFVALRGAGSDVRFEPRDVRSPC